MITCIAGRPGSGKSYYMTELIYASLKKGRKVLTNAKSINIRRMAFDIEKRGGRNRHETVSLFRTCNIRDISVIDWETVRDTDIYLDEVMVVWLSREWKKFPQSLIRFLSQHRKLKCNLFYVTQSADLVDSSLRALTGQFIECRNLSHYRVPFLKIGLPEIFVLRFFAEDRKISQGKEYVWPSKRYFNYFDSFAFVVDDIEDGAEVVDLSHVSRAKGRG